MAKKGGFQGGMPGNMNNLIKQAQRMQRQMEQKQAELEKQVFEATAGGEAVKIQITGKKEIVGVEIQPEVVDPDDIEMLQDLIMAAVNEAYRKVDDAMNEQLGDMAGNMNLGGINGLNGLM